MIRRLLAGRWWVIDAPPSMYLTTHLTLREARTLLRMWGPTHKLHLDITGRYTRNFIKTKLR